MTESQKAAHFETLKHIKFVSGMLSSFAGELLARGIAHDLSKLESPEMGLFAEVTPLLSGMTFGSKEYKKTLEKIKPAIEHHTKNNSHHPEFYENGIDGMNLIDIVEMFCDWWMASKRHDDGDIYRSLEINKKRCNVSDQVISIFKNTIEYFEKNRND
jgi:hypothetical protein